MDIVRLADRVGPNATIENAKFLDSLVVGPAVLLPIDDVTIHDCQFEGLPDSFLIEVPANQPVAGVIGLRSVVFERCVFRDVAIAGTSDGLAQVRASLTPAPPEGAIPRAAAPTAAGAGMVGV